jgi:hypothetical protein
LRTLTLAVPLLLPLITSWSPSEVSSPSARLKIHWPPLPTVVAADGDGLEAGRRRLSKAMVPACSSVPTLELARTFHWLLPSSASCATWCRSRCAGHR